ncbi:peptidase C48 family domain-containing protein (plasmid) [Rhizobium sp. CIAT894]|uniref:Ulp1 family isopeptidase n=1 Tax=Rhizobium sp. CIAT894 TaxID=2020312 RepID=UPI000A1F8CA0|nr:Ulp1 family isopeptidase [Rhizobium sp. CIAT894]ARM91329.1 peptidase C48 family domain-containing protein [Rhizobium sp. CIAT894]
MYPRRNQPRDDDSREVSGWIEGVTGAFDTDAWIEDYYSESRDMEQDPSDLRLGSHDSDAGDRVPRRRSVGGSMRVTPQSLAPERGSGQQDVDAATETHVVSTKARVGAKRGRPADRDMHPDDETRINQFAEAVRNYEILPDGSVGRGDGRVPEATVENNLGILRRFARWLRAENRDSMASRLLNDPDSLAVDIADYYLASGGDGRNRLKSALSHFRRLAPEGQELQAVGPGPRLMGRQIHDPYPDDARVIDSLAKEELSKFGPVSTSRNNTSHQRKFSAWLKREGRESIVSRLTGSDEQQQSLKEDFRAFTKEEGKKVVVSFDRLRQYLGAESQLKQHHPYPDDARIIDDLAKEALSKLGSNSTSKRNVVWNMASNQRKFSAWLQREGRESIVSRLTGTDQQQQSLQKDYQDFTEDMGKHTISFKRLRQYQQVVEANAASGLSPEPASGREPAGLDGRSDSRAEFRSTSPLQQVDPPIESRSGLSLDHTEWLGDQHIQTDYELLMQDLQRNDPDLAARTRLIDPLIAHYHLRLGDESTALSAFQRIVNDQNGRDTADFLFLPVSDASASDPDHRGTHWSLLLVDRRNREGPAAYHYDSFRGQNNEFAAMLAQRLGTRLEPVRMTQQRNDYDCGVFVVDGTRALVRRLARRGRPAVLHLDNLVADREQLQRRLSPAPNSARAGAAAAEPESSTQIADPAEFWHGVAQPGQLPDSWNTATFRQDLPSAAYSPVQSVNPPDAPWEQSLGASIFGTPQYTLPVDDLGGFVPPSWRHGNQPVPDDLLPAMYLFDLLPSADKPTNFSIHGVPYTATLGPSGMQSDIYLFLQ